MFNIKTLNKISKVGLSQFDDIENPDAIMVRSASMHDMQLPASVKAIARAGAGTNNIPCDKCAEQGVVVFNTPGANANAVKELVIAGLLMSSRKVVPGIEWAKTLKGEGDQVGKLVEKGKSAFAGPEIMGKTLGVIGLGAIGVLVANAAEKLGMTVYGYDPYLSVNAAWNLSRNVKHSTSLDEIYANCDYITIHVPLNDDTKNTVNAETIAKMKDGVRILNFARGGLVDSDAIIKALGDGKVASYVVDFPDEKVLDVDGVIAIPHLGASTPESEENCAYMAANELIAYLEKNGYEFTDFGTYTAESCNYADYGAKVAEAVAFGGYDRGILICGTGIGMSIVANKVPGIRCAHCHDSFSARATRMHNDANVIAFGERVIGSGVMIDIVEAFLTTEFEGGRHLARIAKISEIEKKYSK